MQTSVGEGNYFTTFLRPQQYRKNISQIAYLLQHAVKIL